MKSPTTVADLPAELLLLIFKLVHAKVLVYSRPRTPSPVDQPLDSSQEETEWDERDDLRSPRTFPYGLAFVCSHWKKLLGTVPAFWTRIVIITDSRYFTPAFIRSQLEWSRNLPITVSVTSRRENAFFTAPNKEKRRLRHIIDIVRPHLSRCMMISYNLTYTSSLPWVTTDFVGEAPLLDELELRAAHFLKVDPPVKEEANLETFHCPILSTLVLDGQNFAHLFVTRRNWLDNLYEQEDLQHLALSHYHPVEDENPLSFDDVWPFLRKIRNLTLQHVDFVTGAGCLKEPDDDCAIICLAIKGLYSSLTATILSRAAMVATLTIVRCSLHEVENMNCEAFYISIEGIDNPDAISRLLVPWKGIKLSVVDCPGFNDRVLEVLGAPEVDEKDRIKKFPAKALQQLVFEGPCHISIFALRMFVQSRMRPRHSSWPDEDGDDVDADVSRLRVLYGEDFQEPTMPVEDRVWFGQNVGSFQWPSGQENCRRNGPHIF